MWNCTRRDRKKKIDKKNIQLEICCKIYNWDQFMIRKYFFSCFFFFSPAHEIAKQKLRSVRTAFDPCTTRRLNIKWKEKIYWSIEIWDQSFEKKRLRLGYILGRNSKGKWEEGNGGQKVHSTKEKLTTKTHTSIRINTKNMNQIN